MLLLSASLHSALADIICKVGLVAGTDNEHIEFICDVVFNSDIADKTALSIVLPELSEAILEANKEALINNEWYITFPSSWLSENMSPQTIEIPPGGKVTTVDPMTLGRRLQQYFGLRKSSRKVARKRQTRETKNEESVYIVLVSAQDEQLNVQAATATQIVLGNGMSAKNQFSACSFGEVELVPYKDGDGDAVTEITLGGNIGDYDKNTVRTAAQKIVCSEFGLTSSCDPASSKGIDHIIYVVPFGLSSDTGSKNGFGRGAIGGTYVVFQGLAFAPQTVMHEFGHNWLLGHAGEGNDEYGDDTGQMGRSNALCLHKHVQTTTHLNIAQRSVSLFR